VVKLQRRPDRRRRPRNVAHDLVTDFGAHYSLGMSGLGALLRRLRKESGLTQEELAQRAGVSARTISDTERGLRRRLYANTAGRLAAAVGLEGSIRDSFVEVARGRADAEPHAAATVPNPLTPLVGRKEELAAIIEDMQPGARRLVTVTGLGGVGKTRLAVAAAEALAPAYEGRVRLVRLTPGSDPARLVDMVAAALGTAPSSVAAGVAGRPTLLVLDAFEHVLSATGALGDLLGRARELHALVTSRERLRVLGERELALGPLTPEAAAALFLDRVHDLAPQLPQDPVVVGEICRLVSGLPLPLELAAAHVRYLPLELLRDRLRSDVTDAHHVVQEAVSWSVSSLSADQRDVLAAAAMFRAGWRLDGLQALCQGVDVIEALGALADRSLVHLDAVAPTQRWRMLDVVREVAADLAPGHPWRRAAFMSYYRRLLEDVSSRLGQERSWYQVVSAEEPNVRQALTWAQQDGDAAAEAAGHDLAALAAEHGDPVTRRDALTIAGMVAIARDRPHDAIAALTEALGVARVLHQPWLLATSLLNLGLGHLALGEPARARPILGEAVQRYDEIGDERFHARCLGYLGLTSLLDGDPDRAGALFAQSLRAFADLAEPAGTAEGLSGIAAVAAATGRATTAATLGGAAERVRKSVTARELPLERRATAPHLASAEHTLGPAEWARAWRSGRELTLAAAVSLALAGQPRLRRPLTAAVAAPLVPGRGDQRGPDGVRLVLTDRPGVRADVLVRGAQSGLEELAREGRQSLLRRPIVRARPVHARTLGEHRGLPQMSDRPSRRPCSVTHECYERGPGPQSRSRQWVTAYRLGSSLDVTPDMFGPRPVR